MVAEITVSSMERFSLDALRILIVDDDVDSREMLMFALEGEGAEVISVGSVADAIEILAQQQPDLLISDIRMPGEDGYSLLRQMREKAPEIPAIAVTAFARVEDREDALAAGFQCHIAKPIDLVELYKTVSTLMGRSLEA